MDKIGYAYHKSVIKFTDHLRREGDSSKNYLPLFLSLPIPVEYSYRNELVGVLKLFIANL